MSKYFIIFDANVNGLFSLFPFSDNSLLCKEMEMIFVC